jgi:predicted nucleic acid-binding protein
MTGKNREFFKSFCVITDIGCLVELSGIKQLELLHKLYGKIHITPETAKGFKKKLPEWIEIRDVKNKNLVREINKILGPGEASSIALANETPESLLILDGNEGISFALNNLGLTCMGTAGVIRNAFYCGYIENIEKAKEYFNKATEQFVDSTINIETIFLSNKGD